MLKRESRRTGRGVLPVVEVAAGGLLCLLSIIQVVLAVKATNRAGTGNMEVGVWFMAAIGAFSAFVVGLILFRFSLDRFTRFMMHFGAVIGLVFSLQIGLLAWT